MDDEKEKQRLLFNLKFRVIGKRRREKNLIF
jgi:hypothetical protein